MSKMGFEYFKAKLMEGTGWDSDKATAWLLTPNPHFGNAVPNNLIVTGRGHKIDEFVDAATARNQVKKEDE